LPVSDRVDGALMGMISSLLVFQLGQARLVCDVARWALAEAIQPGPQTVPHTRFLHLLQVSW
jgi:hypothetical protein